MKLLIDETLPLIDELFSHPCFEVSLFNKSQTLLLKNVDAVICRAHTQINQHFFNDYRAKLIATASSGSDHIDKDWLS